MAEFNFNFVREHPYWFGIPVVLIGGYIFYRVYTGGSTSTELSSEAEFQQLQSAQQLQQGQYQAQLDLANANAGAQIAVIDASFRGQIDLAKQGQSVYDDYLDTQVVLADGSNKTTVDVANIQANAAVDITQLQTDVQQAYIAAEVQAHQDTINFGTAIITSPQGDIRRRSVDLIAAILGNASYQGADVRQDTGTGFKVAIPGVGSVGVSGL